MSSSVRSGLTKKAEPPPTRDVNRDSGTASANGGWLRRLVRHRGTHLYQIMFSFGSMPHSTAPLGYSGRNSCDNLRLQLCHAKFHTHNHISKPNHSGSTRTNN